MSSSIKVRGVRRRRRMIRYLILIPLLAFFIGENYLCFGGFPPSSFVSRSGHERDYTEIPCLNKIGVAPSRYGQISTEDTRVFEGVNENRTRKSLKQASKKADTNVIVVGCSYTYGQGVPDWQTYVWRLNERFANIRFDNYGVPGFGTLQAYYWLEEALKRPDAPQYRYVIYGALDDHLKRNVRAAVLADPDYGSMSAMPYARYSGGKLVEYYGHTWYWPGADSFRMIYFLGQLYCYTRSHELPSDDEQVAVFNAYVEKMITLSEQHNSKLLMLNLEEQTDRFLYPEVKKRLVVLGSCRPNGIEAQYRVNGVGHPNGVIHQEWADTVAEWFVSKGY